MRFDNITLKLAILSVFPLGCDGNRYSSGCSKLCPSMCKGLHCDAFNGSCIHGCSNPNALTVDCLGKIGNSYFVLIGCWETKCLYHCSDFKLYNSIALKPTLNDQIYISSHQTKALNSPQYFILYILPLRLVQIQMPTYIVIYKNKVISDNSYRYVLPLSIWCRQRQYVLIESRSLRLKTSVPESAFR